MPLTCPRGMCPVAFPWHSGTRGTRGQTAFERVYSYDYFQGLFIQKKKSVSALLQL